MDEYNVYKDIKARTDGEIYIGVVGPVRTGKSTFIKKFMELVVLPEIKDSASKERALDEMPISGVGTIVTTTEPKFIPKEAVKISISDDIDVAIRLIDCVGYVIDGVEGVYNSDGSDRLVKAPWFDYDIPFTKAADIGTKKVINDHSTIAVVVTADGSFSDIKRESYIPAEEKTINELKSLKKPFIVVLNTQKPYSEETIALAKSLEEKYGVTVLPVNCSNMKQNDILNILSLILKEFPISEIGFYIPKWVEMIPISHPLKADMITKIKGITEHLLHIKDITKEKLYFTDDYITDVRIDVIDMSTGKVNVTISVNDQYYYEILSDITKIDISGEYQLINILKELAALKDEYTAISSAISMVRATGYSVVTPAKEEITLYEPEVIKHGNQYGVKIRADAPSIHLIKTSVETEIAPIVGSEQQANDLIAYIKNDSSDSEGIWNTNIFGKTIEQLVDDGMKTKVSRMTDESIKKIQDTLQKVVNDSNGGLVCIII